MNRRGLIWLFTGLVLALLAGGLTFRTLAEATTAAQQASIEDIVMSNIVVAAQNIPMRTIVTRDQVQIKEVPVELVPEGALTTLDSVVGRMTLRDMVTGEVILASRVVDPAKPDAPIPFTLPDDRVLIAVPATDLMSQISVLQTGDHVDLLFTLPVVVEVTGEDGTKETEEHLVTFNSLQNVEISAFIVAGFSTRPSEAERGSLVAERSALLVAVEPQDALMLKWLKDNGAIMDVALRAPDNDSLFNVTPVDIQYMADRFLYGVRR